MNTTELPVRPDVSTFVATVRELLADLPEEDRLELTEGLEADLTDQVAEHGRGVLGDPAAYARELRSAAGLEAAPGRRGGGGPTGMSLDERLDRLRAGLDDWAAHPRIAPAWAVVAALRPAWWVLRAWIAAVLAVWALPRWNTHGLTWLPGVPEWIGVLVLTAAVVLSALVGLGRLWPGAGTAGDRGAFARLAVIGLNVFAVAMIPVVEDQLRRAHWDRMAADGAFDSSWVNALGVVNRGEQVCNIAAYDAQGQPLVGVQLFDQAGRPLDVRCHDQQATTVPWVLGDVTRWNVYPLAERERPARTARRRADLTGAAFPAPDRASTPPVTHPLVPPTEADPGKPGRTEADPTEAGEPPAEQTDSRERRGDRGSAGRGAEQAEKEPGGSGSR